MLPLDLPFDQLPICSLAAGQRDDDEDSSSSGDDDDNSAAADAAAAKSDGDYDTTSRRTRTLKRRNRVMTMTTTTTLFPARTTTTTFRARTNVEGETPRESVAMDRFRSLKLYEKSKIFWWEFPVGKMGDSEIVVLYRRGKERRVTGRGWPLKFLSTVVAPAVRSLRQGGASHAKGSAEFTVLDRRNVQIFGDDIAELFALITDQNAKLVQ